MRVSACPIEYSTTAEVGHASVLRLGLYVPTISILAKTRIGVHDHGGDIKICCFVHIIDNKNTDYSIKASFHVSIASRKSEVGAIDM